MTPVGKWPNASRNVDGLRSVGFIASILARARWRPVALRER
jgi:hypothetical protein